MQKLIAKLTSGVIDDDDSDDDDDCDCSALWRDHPLLSPPKTWTELRERNILTDHAFKVAHLSAASTTKKSRNAKSSKSDRAGTNVRTSEESRDSSSVRDIMEGKVQVNLKQSLLEDFLSQEMFDVYSFPLLTKEVRYWRLLFVSDLRLFRQD